MEIFVSELPKSCRGCLFQCYGSCLGGRDILNGDPYTGICHLKRQKPTDCPLKLITDRVAEERKKVVQEIKKVLDNKASYSTDADDDWLIQIKESSLYEILDKIERNEDV